jgi:hypothetical protein
MADDIVQDFDQLGWDTLAGCLSTCQNIPGFAGWENAHNAIATRFRAAALADEKFAESFLDAGQRYTQEESLFAFFFNAVSCVECFLYGLHHIGNLVAPNDFPIATDTDLRDIRRGKVMERFTRVFPNDSLTKLIESVVSDDQFCRMLEFRDVLTHRGSIPRQHHVVVPVSGARQKPAAVFVSAKPKSAVSTTDTIPLGTTTTNSMRDWLASRLRELFSETLNFCEDRLV